VFDKKKHLRLFFPSTASSSLIILACSRPTAGVEDALLLPHLRQCAAALEALADAKAHSATKRAVLLPSLTDIYLFSSPLFSTAINPPYVSVRRREGTDTQAGRHQANYGVVERGKGFLRCVRSDVEELIGLPRRDLPAQIWCL
jgi:hypothetical protein